MIETCMKKLIYLTISLLVLSCTRVNQQAKIFMVDVNQTLGINTRFWKASVTDLLYALTEEPTGQFLLDRMGETKSNSFLRNHATLSERVRNGVQVGIKVYSEDEKGNPIYDFTRVNRIFKEFVKRGQKPIVECDYIPKELLHN